MADGDTDGASVCGADGCTVVCDVEDSDEEVVVGVGVGGNVSAS
jgi:hypothetical protein